MARASHDDADEPRTRALAELAERIGHEFEDLERLNRALVHASTGQDGLRSYERLEYLGDAILGFLVAEHLFREHPDASEGELTQRRADLVSQTPLAELARSLGLVRHLRHGRGMRDTDLASERIHADLVEAVLAAVFLDGGIQAARRFVRRHVLAGPRPRPTPERPLDPKSRLLHFAQAAGLGQPSYRLLDARGPDHEREFEVAVWIDGRDVATGTARSKRGAEMAAARLALARLAPEAEPDGAPAGGDAGEPGDPGERDDPVEPDDAGD
ncbi:MAG: ribonuclease III [Planctomycetes bacterium]|nr:ribonuclease III [Planctomycetota bacterium]